VQLNEFLIRGMIAGIIAGIYALPYIMLGFVTQLYQSLVCSLDICFFYQQINVKYETLRSLIINILTQPAAL